MNEEKVRRYVFIARFFSALLAIIIIIVGIGIYFFFSSFRKPPAQAREEERPLLVEVIQTQPVDFPIVLNGFGEVRPLANVPISPEVSGRVIRIHSNLEVGEVIPEGDVLFEIEPSDYQIQLQTAEANLGKAKETLSRLQKQFVSDKERLKTLERSRDLAYTEFQRVKTLFERDKVGTQSNVEQAERTYNQLLDSANLLAQAVELYPLQIKEAEESVKSADAQLKKTEIDLSRTQVKSPFLARVVNVNLEAGQYVNPGAVVLTISDDSIMEISVPLDSREATQWLPFQNSVEPNNFAWFPPLEPRECNIFWTEDKGKHQWKGILNRVEKYDETTRTVYAVVRIEGENLFSLTEDKMPLVQAMFCNVKIPGKTLIGVYRLPDTAVSFEGIVYLSVDKRLHSVKVERLYMQGDEVIVKGLEAGATVVKTRLVNPIENSLLEYNEPKNEGSQS